MQNLNLKFRENGIDLNGTQQEQFEMFFSHLFETNKKFNLTAITDEDDVLVKHFLDSAIVHKLLPHNASAIDVGSGAGFPAIPLKIVRPDLKMCLLDALGKRVNFLNETISLLNLSDCVAVHARAEDFAAKNRESFDIAIARAVAPLCTLVEYLLPFVKIRGQAVIMKSSKLEEELLQAEKAIRILGGKIEKIENFELENMERKILIVRKVSTTPKQYPRGKNKPKLSPIL